MAGSNGLDLAMQWSTQNIFRIFHVEARSISPLACGLLAVVINGILLAVKSTHENLIHLLVVLV